MCIMPDTCMTMFVLYHLKAEKLQHLHTFISRSIICNSYTEDETHALNVYEFV